LPKPPSNPPIVSLITETSISLTLEPVIAPNDSGSVVTGYIVQIDDGNGGAFTEVHNSLDLTLILTGLQSGRRYRIRYAARNIILDEDNLFECESLEFSDTAYVLTAVYPSRPLNLRFDPTHRYRTALTFRWDPPESSGGVPLETYTLEITNLSTGIATEVTITVQALMHKFESLISATEYKVRMKVTNLLGDSDWTDYVQAMTGIEPTRPGILTFTASTRTTLDLSWIAIVGQDTGGTSANPLLITSQFIYMDDGLEGDFQLLATIPGTDAPQYTVQYMSPGRTYRFKIKVENQIGLQSDYSTVQFMRAGQLPSIPGAP